MKNPSGGVKFVSAGQPEYKVAPQQFSYSTTTSRYQTLVKDWHDCKEERWILLACILLVTSGKVKQIT